MLSFQPQTYKVLQSQFTIILLKAIFQLLNSFFKKQRPIIILRFQLMLTNRVRQFNKIRQKNLSETYSHIGQSSVYGLSIGNNTTSFLNSPSNFLKKNKDPICIKCVNKKMINQKHDKNIKQKAQELSQTLGLMQKSKSYTNQIKQIRNKITIQTVQYNLKASRQHLNNAQFDKISDSVFMKKACEQQRQDINKQQQQRILHEARQENYRRQLHKQYQEQLAKKQHQKNQRIKTQPDKCLVKGYDSRALAKKYAQQLKKQIMEQKARKEHWKQAQTEKERQLLEESDKDFLRYSEYSQYGSSRSRINPQIFEQMKQLQQKKIAQKNQARQKKDKQRKQALIEAKEQQKIIAKKSLLRVKSYAATLNSQIKAKNISQQYIKRQEKRHRQKQQQYTEDLSKFSTSFKPCGQCQVEVNQVTLCHYD